MPVSAVTASMPMTQATRRDVVIPMQAAIMAAASVEDADSKMGGVMPPFLCLWNRFVRCGRAQRPSPTNYIYESICKD